MHVWSERACALAPGRALTRVLCSKGAVQHLVVPPIVHTVHHSCPAPRPSDRGRRGILNRRRGGRRRKGEEADGSFPRGHRALAVQLGGDIPADVCHISSAGINVVGHPRAADRGIVRCVEGKLRLYVLAALQNCVPGKAEAAEGERRVGWTERRGRGSARWHAARCNTLTGARSALRLTRDVESSMFSGARPSGSRGPTLVPDVCLGCGTLVFFKIAQIRRKWRGRRAGRR